MDSMFYAGGLLGLAVGMVVTFPIALLMAAHQRRRDAQADLVAANILRGYELAREEISTGRHAARESAPSWLADTNGALAEARAHAAAIVPYPGNDGSKILGGTGRFNEPDEAWLAWLDEYPRPVPQDPTPTEGTAWVVWSRSERALARLTLIALSTFGDIYPWWQHLADRLWEFSVSFETRGIRVNRATQKAIDDFVGACYWLAFDALLAVRKLAGSWSDAMRWRYR